MKWNKRYKDYYEYYADKLGFPKLFGLILVAIGIVAFLIYGLLH